MPIKCPICFDAFAEDNPPIILKECGHSFHRRCLERQVVSARDPYSVLHSCACCRSPFFVNSVRELYDQRLFPVNYIVISSTASGQGSVASTVSEHPVEPIAPRNSSAIGGRGPEPRPTAGTPRGAALLTPDLGVTACLSVVCNRLGNDEGEASVVLPRGALLPLFVSTLISRGEAKASLHEIKTLASHLNDSAATPSLVAIAPFLVSVAALEDQNADTRLEALNVVLILASSCPDVSTELVRLVQGEVWSIINELVPHVAEAEVGRGDSDRLWTEMMAKAALSLLLEMARSSASAEPGLLTAESSAPENTRRATSLLTAVALHDFPAIQCVASLLLSKDTIVEPLRSALIGCRALSILSRTLDRVTRSLGSQDTFATHRGLSATVIPHLCNAVLVVGRDFTSESAAVLSICCWERLAKMLVGRRAQHATALYCLQQQLLLRPALVDLLAVYCLRDIQVVGASSQDASSADRFVTLLELLLQSVFSPPQDELSESEQETDMTNTGLELLVYLSASSREVREALVKPPLQNQLASRLVTMFHNVGAQTDEDSNITTLLLIKLMLCVSRAPGGVALLLQEARTLPTLVRLYERLSNEPTVRLARSLDRSTSGSLTGNELRATAERLLSSLCSEASGSIAASVLLLEYSANPGTIVQAAATLCEALVRHERERTIGTRDRVSQTPARTASVHQETQTPPPRMSAPPAPATELLETQASPINVIGRNLPVIVKKAMEVVQTGSTAPSDVQHAMIQLLGFLAIRSDFRDTLVDTPEFVDVVVGVVVAGGSQAEVETDLTCLEALHLCSNLACSTRGREKLGSSAVLGQALGDVLLRVASSAFPTSSPPRALRLGARAVANIAFASGAALDATYIHCVEPLCTALGRLNPQGQDTPAAIRAGTTADREVVIRTRKEIIRALQNLSGNSVAAVRMAQCGVIHILCSAVLSAGA